MAKFFGRIGFSTTQETPVGSGVWVEDIIEREYYGDVITYTRRFESHEKVNDDVTLNTTISVVGDSFAFDNFQFVKYVDWNSAKWKVNSMEVEYPRLKLNIGGLYNAE